MEKRNSTFVDFLLFFDKYQKIKNISARLNFLTQTKSNFNG